MRGVAGLIMVLLVAAAPALAQAPDEAQPAPGTPTTLYFHVDGYQDFAINTQAADPAYERNAWMGLATATAPCGDLPGSPVGAFATDYHTYYGYGSPNLVDYHPAEGLGSVRVSPERGIAYDVEFVADEPFTLYWYLVAGQDTGMVGEVTPMPLPGVQVVAVLREGDAISVDDAAYNAGNLVAQGASEPATLAGEQVVGGNGQVRAVKAQGSAWVYEFAVPMHFEASVLNRTTGYNVRVDLRMDNAACEGAMLPQAGVHTSEGARPRMELAIANPIRITALQPQWIEDDLVLHAAIQSPWGPFDVPLDQLVLEVEGPDAGEFVRQPGIPQTHIHGHCYSCEPVAPSWVWTNASRAAPGHYEVRLVASNLAGTAVTEASAGFDIAPRREMPGPALPLLLVGLAALGAFLRCRSGHS